MRYKLLGRSGLRASELALGTMTFGDAWGWGAAPEVARRIFDLFAEAGGNFVDTASNYTDGQSETLVGEFAESDRGHFVIATKYSLTSLEGGVLTGKYDDEVAPDAGSGEGGTRRYGGRQDETDLRLGREVRSIAAELGRTPAQVAINWVRQQDRGTMVPIVGARTEEQLRDNLGALEFELSPDMLQRLNQANPPDLGFPHSFLASDHVHGLIFGETYDLIDRR